MSLPRTATMYPFERLTKETDWWFKSNLTKASEADMNQVVDRRKAGFPEGYNDDSLPKVAHGKPFITYLPNELLTDILLQATRCYPSVPGRCPLRDVALVSKEWLQLVLTTANFWTDIDLFEPPEHTYALLQRSKQALIDIIDLYSFGGERETNPFVWRVVCAQIHRWRSARLAITKGAMDVLIDAIHMPLSNLRILELSCRNWDEDVSLLDFGRFVEVLRFMPALKRLVVEPELRGFGFSTLYDILDACSILEEADFDGSLRSKVVFHRRSQSKELPNLRYLRLPTTDAPSLNNFLLSITLPSCTELSVLTTSKRPEGYDLYLNISLADSLPCLRGNRSSPCTMTLTTDGREGIQFTITNHLTGRDVFCNGIGGAFRGGTSLWLRWVKAVFAAWRAPIRFRTRSNWHFWDASTGAMFLQSETVTALYVEAASPMAAMVGLFQPLDEDSPWPLPALTELELELSSWDIDEDISELSKLVALRYKRLEGTHHHYEPNESAILPPRFSKIKLVVKKPTPDFQKLTEEYPGWIVSMQGFGTNPDGREDRIRAVLRAEGNKWFEEVTNSERYEELVKLVGTGVIEWAIELFELEDE